MKISKIALFSILLAVAVPAVAQELRFKTTDGYSSWNLNTASGWQNLGPSGTWWRNQSYITALSITPEQQKRMDEVFQQSRIKLIDLTAAFDKEEAILEPLVKADRLDENKVALQLDKVADARAELEKANARMLLGIRMVLTTEQWTKLNSSKLGFYGEALKPKYKNAEKLFGIGK
jgi:Spy/CpxP family protein refolding chaperone